MPRKQGAQGVRNLKMRAWSLAGPNCTGSFVVGMMTMEGILKAERDEAGGPDITQMHLIVIGITSLAVPRVCLSLPRVQQEKAVRGLHSPTQGRRIDGCVPTALRLLVKERYRRRATGHIEGSDKIADQRSCNDNS